MLTLIWVDIDSSLQSNVSKWLDSSCDSTLIRLEQVMIWLWVGEILNDSDSKGLWLWLDKYDSAHHSHWCFIKGPVSSKISNLCEISDLIIFCQLFCFSE